MAYERVTLYGLPLVAAPPRRVRGRRAGRGARAVHPARPRRGGLGTRHHFFRDNQALREELEELEERARRRDLVITDDELYAWYDARLPPAASVGAPLRRLVEEAAAPHARTC